MVFHPSRKVYVHNLKKGTKHGGSLDIKQPVSLDSNSHAINSYIPPNIKYKPNNYGNPTPLPFPLASGSRESNGFIKHDNNSSLGGGSLNISFAPKKNIQKKIKLKI